MQIALEEANKAFDEGEIPVGALIVKEGVILAQSHNLREALSDSTAHAEILAIKDTGGHPKPSLCVIVIKEMA